MFGRLRVFFGSGLDCEAFAARLLIALSRLRVYLDEVQGMIFVMDYPTVSAISSVIFSNRSTREPRGSLGRIRSPSCELIRPFPCWVLRMTR